MQVPALWPGFSSETPGANTSVENSKICGGTTFLPSQTKKTKKLQKNHKNHKTRKTPKNSKTTKQNTQIKLLHLNAAGLKQKTEDLKNKIKYPQTLKLYLNPRKSLNIP